MSRANKGKTGELTSSQIIVLVLAVLSFIIILGWIYLFQDDSFTQDEVCKLSVLTRGTAPDRFQGSVPLKCSAKKICITEEGDCKENLAVEEIDKTVRLSGDTGDKAGRIEEVSAEAMYDCWDMMGQGKIDIFGKYITFEVPEPTCIICSRIAVDKSVSDSVLNEVDIYDYLKRKSPSGSDKTYLELFTNEQFSTYPTYTPDVLSKAIRTREANKDDKVINYNNGREIAFVFMQIKSKSAVTALKEFGTDAALLVGGAYFMTPNIKGSRSKLWFNGATSRVLAYGAIIASEVTVFNAWTSQELAAGYCGTFVTNDEKAKEGCSLVQAVPYTVNNINQLCMHLEGSP